MCLLIQFDPLLVESLQSGTCVLMLDSPEDDVVIKAAEAIYKFVEKCKLLYFVDDICLLCGKHTL